jgi:hypothetical protein
MFLIELGTGEKNLAEMIIVSSLYSKRELIAAAKKLFNGFCCHALSRAFNTNYLRGASSK